MSSMSVNVEDQVAEDDVEDLDDLENIEGENNAQHKSRQRKKGSEEKNNLERNTLVDASDEACIANWQCTVQKPLAQDLGTTVWQPRMRHWRPGQVSGLCTLHRGLVQCI